jgi:NlpC/P60 family putative phage cell wall peptidase
MTTRENVVAEARTWLGTPYHPMARVKGVGVDCAQILAAVYGAVGLAPADLDLGYYPPDWHLHRSEERYLAQIERHAKGRTDEPLPGDVALFRFGRCVSHSGIVVAWPLVVHAYLGRGVVLSRADEAELQGRAAGFYTFWDQP